MQDRFRSFTDVIDLGDTIADFADDSGVPFPTAASWRQRDRIPAHKWTVVVAAAKKRGFPGVTPEALSRLAASRQRRAPERRAAS